MVPGDFFVIFCIIAIYVQEIRQSQPANLLQISTYCIQRSSILNTIESVARFPKIIPNFVTLSNQHINIESVFGHP